MAETEEKRKGGNAKLETPVQNAKCKNAPASHRQNPFAVLGRLAWQDARRRHCLQTLSHCSACTTASQPVAQTLHFSHRLRGGQHWMSGSNPVSGSGTASQEHSGPPVVSAGIRSSWQRLQSLPISATGAVRTRCQRLGKMHFP